MSQDHWASQFNEAKPKSSSAYIVPGNFFLRIDNIERGKSRKGVGNFKIEGTVVHCFDGDNKVGQSVCDMNTEASDFFFNEVKSLIADIMNMSVEDVTFANFERVASKEQPLRGFVVEYSAWNKESKKTPGNFFTKKKCKGRITKNQYMAVADQATQDRFLEDCRFKKED